MRSRIFGLAVFLAGVLFASMGLTACADTVKSYEQVLDRTECTEHIDNPDQGFYRPMYVKVNENGAVYNKNIVTAATRLYHLRADIGAFSGAVNGTGDKPLDRAALDGIAELLTYLKANDKNAIVRFAYDPAFGGAEDKEPSLPTVLEHIEQICGVVDGYASTVTAIEVGLVGPWGEMHTSAMAKPECITPMIEAFLSHTTEIPVLVRTPKMIYDYIGITVRDIDGYTVAADSKAYRLGLYNDGYLGSSTDLGTFTDREREIGFLSKQTEHLPYGGEVVEPASKLHDIDKCLPEMFAVNLSYLNIEWNNYVITKWKNSVYTAECGDDANFYGKSAFDYIAARLGYRFVLEKSVFSYSQGCEKLKIALQTKNVGFGNLNKPKRAELVFVSDGEVVLTRAVDDFTGASKYECSLETDLQVGDYAVYLRLYGDASDGAHLYCLRFANTGMWNAELRANKIGEVTIQ